MVGVTVARGIHDEFFESIDPQASRVIGWPFPVRVAVPRGRSPRHEMFSLTKEMGSGLLPDIMAGRPLAKPGRTELLHLTFVFPERHLEPWEQQSFFHLLMANPSYALIGCVDVVTQCPLIVGDCTAEMIRLISWPDEDEANRAFSKRAGELVRQALDRTAEYRRKVER
jgi:hypothetical protein